VAVDAIVVGETVESEVIELETDDFFTGYRKTNLPRGAVIEKIMVPLNESGDREVVKKI
jgi:xanthine dehydrogenase iron-sulfur cluster and FAD-binding subunit A